MKVYFSLEEFEKGDNAVATIGTFDGVHQGHKKILNRLIESARSIQGESIVISLHPHPRIVLYPEDNPLRLLQTIEEKISTLRDLGIDKLLLIPFSKSFSRTTSEQFIEEILVRTVGIKKIIIGYDHQFGKNRTGGLKELQNGAGRFGYEVEEIPAQQIDDANVSSTKIRHALAAGQVEAAQKFLGYSYPLTGTVIEGEKLGRQLGYPTANIQPSDRWKQIPGEGVYLTEVWVKGLKHYGMLNIGKKPTVGEFPLGLEVNIFDFDQDIYGEEVTLRFLSFIRTDKKFDGVDALVAAIDQDKKDCLSLLEKIKN